MKALGVLIFFALVTTSCGYFSDTVTHKYGTLAEARTEGLVANGWLPDVLPASTTDILTSNNLDLNFSTGDFAFSAADAPDFYRRLAQGAPARAPFESWEDTVNDYEESGYTALSYSEDVGTWAFFCHAKKGKCDYFFWLRRPAADNSFKLDPIRGQA